MDHQQLQYTIFFFSSDGTSLAGQKYELLMRCAEFGDAQGFRAIWTPERHFSQFGGLYPNPSILGAAIAARTSRIEVRAGSVVLPLHNPIRVAEEWSVVDNLSNGRVELSFAPGWNPGDFALAPEQYARRYEALYEGLALVKRLWAGEQVEVSDGAGKTIRVRT